MIYFGHVTSRGTALAYLIDTHGANATYILALNDLTDKKNAIEQLQLKKIVKYVYSYLSY